MPATPTPENAAGRAGSTPAEGPVPEPGAIQGVENPAENSIQKAREVRDAASGYAALLAEVTAIEAKVSGSTTAQRRQEVIDLRNKVNRPPLREDFSNSVNSPVVRKQQVDAARAVAAALAAKSF